MTATIGIFLFLLGLALGSFLHVLASRYDPERFLLTRETLGGRSHCPRCRKQLGWRELVPLASFAFQRGRCRGCGARIGWSHVWVEFASGLITLLAPAAALGAGQGILGAAIWTAALLTLLLIALIDMRLQIIPDELVILLVLLGLGLALRDGFFWGLPWAGRFGAAAGALLFFLALIAVTRGRGMGLGDAKLGFALGLLFGWPDTALIVMLSFVIGAAAGVGLIAWGRKSMKSAVPFGPFLALAAVVVFFFGGAILESWYNLMI